MIIVCLDSVSLITEDVTKENSNASCINREKKLKIIHKISVFFVVSY